MPHWHFSKPRIPFRAVVIAVAALSVPFLDTSFAGPSTGTDTSTLLWLLALVPAFMLAYYRGWKGVATALAAGMAMLTIAICIALLRNGTLHDSLLLPVISAYILITLAIGFVSEALHGGRERAELIALTDDLTGLPNRRHGRMYLEAELARSNGPVSIIMFDLDHFKLYNDRHGHPAGDVILRSFAEVLMRITGVGGMPVRYGGEEFLTVLSSCDEQGAKAYAQRVREALAFEQRNHETITVCAGIATVGGVLQTANDLIIAADRALYEAKQGGRDCIRVAPQPMAALG
ncbi:MAG TPA: diguanylate cyclase [Longimicrobiales bacterium]|nr:diguanylate cyclase [Longimicrobiales bacterium]